MLQLTGDSSTRTCDGHTRRDFVRVGALGLSGLTLPFLLQARARAGLAGKPLKNRSVVWLWLGGGATHVETFDPKMDAPAEFRSTVGAVSTCIPGVQIGGLFPQMASLLQHMILVRSFGHTNSGHAGGTHWVMTGYNHPPADQGEKPIRPSMGSILSRYRGASNEVSGMPTYVRMNGIYADGPSFLGVANAPFDSRGQAKKNMNLGIPVERLGARRALLKTFDHIEREMDRNGLMEGMDQFEVQAFDLILGKAKDAFDLNLEDAKTRERYGKRLGEQMLLARRLCEAGCGFVNIHYGGWDMHGDIANALKGRCPEMDHAVSVFLQDLVDRGMLDDVLLVITGEFGRTPRVNGGAGRDHWAQLSTLALAGGGLRTGQVVGESSPKAELPKSDHVSPQDLMATVFHVLGIDPNIHFYDQAGRPTAMIERGKPITHVI